MNLFVVCGFFGSFIVYYLKMKLLNGIFYVY
jgi:hypothetical protein